MPDLEPNEPQAVRPLEAASSTGAARDPISAAIRREADGTGLDRVREILFGDTFAEIERRLVRAEAHLNSRARELHEDARRRTDVLEAHVRREAEATSTRSERRLADLGEAIHALRAEHRDVHVTLEQRLVRLEERLDGALARVERDARDMLHDHAKAVLDQIEETRHQLLATLASELGLEPERPGETGDRGADAWPAPH
jgi:hypothetical protein